MQFDHIFFCHIPKTAGTSIWMSARKHFASERTLYGRAYTEVAMLNDEELNRFAYIHLHYPLQLKKRLTGSSFSFFFVREPIARILSLYNFWRQAYLRAPQDWQPLTGPYRAGTQVLSVFLADERNQIEFVNAQARYICGDSANFSVAGIDRTSLLTTARSVNCVCVTEEFSRSVNLLNQRLGVSLFDESIIENKTSAANDVDRPIALGNLDAIELKLLRKMTELDSVLYDIAQEIFYSSLN